MSHLGLYYSRVVVVYHHCVVLNCSIQVKVQVNSVLTAVTQSAPVRPEAPMTATGPVPSTASAFAFAFSNPNHFDPPTIPIPAAPIRLRRLWLTGCCCCCVGWKWSKSASMVSELVLDLQQQGVESNLCEERLCIENPLANRLGVGTWNRRDSKEHAFRSRTVTGWMAWFLFRCHRFVVARGLLVLLEEVDEVIVYCCFRQDLC